MHNTYNDESRSQFIFKQTCFKYPGIDEIHKKKIKRVASKHGVAGLQANIYNVLHLIHP